MDFLAFRNGKDNQKLHRDGAPVSFINKTSIKIIYASVNFVNRNSILTLLGHGGLNQPTLFSHGYFSRKGSGGPKFCDFSLFIMNFQKINFFLVAILPWKKGFGGIKSYDFSLFIMNFQKIKKIGFFKVFWGDLEGEGTINLHLPLKLHPEAPHY